MPTIVGLPMPQPGETITEGTVVKWLKQEGDLIAEQEPVVELETAKAVYDYESPLAGKLIRIVTPAGQEQKVGRALALMECDDAAAKKYLRLGVGLKVDASGQVEIGVAKIGAMAGFGASPPEGATAMGASRTASTGAAAATGTILPPFIRSLAKERGLSEAELQSIPATGLGGRLTKNDVLQYLERRGTGAGVGAAVRPAAMARGGVALPPALSGSRRVEPAAVRRRIAENMVLSKTTIPHAGSAVEIDMTELLAWREAQKAAFQKQHGCPLRLAPFFLFAVREALKQYPVCNNFYFIDEAGKHWIEEHDAIHLGVAVGTEHGLIVPVLKHAEQKDFVALARESDQLMTKAQARKLTPDELTGATVTVNNPGALGSIRGNQVLPWPQSVIVGLQAIVERPRFIAGQCVARSVMEMSISFDHRLVDGVEAVGLLTAARGILEAPKKHYHF